MTQQILPPFKNLKYCSRCCIPETSEGTVFDEMGICRACQSSEQKMHIDWRRREKELRQILESHKAKSGTNYDCLVPISGGKDSAFQLHVLVRCYGIKPLACTFNTGWMTPTGEYNLWNLLEKLEVDHIQFTPNPDLVSRIARQSLTAIGDSCWHCHAGVGAWPLQLAVKLGISLIVWGESIAEATNKATYADRVQFDETYFKRVSAKVDPSEMTRLGLSPRDLLPFQVPSAEELQALNLTGIHLGEYLFWDSEKQVDFIKSEYGWKEDLVDGTYKGYKSVDCRMAGVHDYAKFVKRGFGRASDHASQDVRAGLLTREEAFEIIRQYDPKRPEELDFYLKLTGWTEEEFMRTLKSHRTGPAKELP